jgi:hypothetical protein
MIANENCGGRVRTRARGAVLVLGRRVFDELLKLLVDLPGLVIQRRHLSIPCDALEALRYGAGQSVEPVVLRKRILHANHARDLIEQAVEGTAVPIDQLRSFEVLLDHRRADYQSMLVHPALKDVSDALLLSDRAPVGVLNATIVGVLLTDPDRELGDAPATVVGLAQNQLDVMLFGHTHERLERVVVIAAQKASRGNQEHPAMQKLKSGIGRLVFTSA